MIPGTTVDSSQSNAKIYARRKRQLWFLDLALTFGLLGGLIAIGLAVSLRSWVISRIPGWPFQVATYVSILGIGTALISFPLDWVRSFMLEHRFGLSTQKFPQWLRDYVKQFILGGILGLIVVEGLVALIRWTPDTWWWWAAFVWMTWSALLTRIAPTVLIPIFYRQRPLENAALRQRLESFLEKCGTRVRGIFEVDLSRTTKKANACLCGLGRTRRVLVSDTLLSAHPAEEVEVVLAHEVGHHQHHHLIILILISTVAAGFSCFLVDRILRSRTAALGLTGLDDLAALPLIALCLLITNLLLMPILNGVSRHLEKQADRFALKQTCNPQAFASTMRRLGEQNLAEPDPPRWVEWFFYDHPSIAKRIAVAEAASSPVKKGGL